MDCTRDSHEAAKHDPAAWDAMAPRGEMPDHDGGTLELRNCDRCGSTLARQQAAPMRVPVRVVTRGAAGGRTPAGGCLR